ncbi:SDR family NAD(P)-dependent oxidoreductase [Roseivirga sp. BDSF3-8]|uniref:SDR family NAD(P)-dependent oxidoreductase n=1 Tax=Roseivirga sp. BDSF3-8 TaxID=3241598 RepID=UPI003531C40A
MSADIAYWKDQIQRSLKAIRKLKEENARLKEGGASDREPIAVVGMSCKLPYANDTLSDFWKALTEGKDLTSDIPADRWDTARYHDPDPTREDTYYVNRGGVLARNHKVFDPAFFNISPTEAKYMDPQQRLLLEAAWEAFENASIAPSTYDKSETGVFIGTAAFDNAIRLHQSHAPVSAYTGTGNTLSGGAGRIAHFFGFNGPVLSTDTACSSSLVALHQACRSLQNSECSAALVGGVNMLLSPEIMVNFCQANMLAPDGRCKTFDESADGYTRGEGVGMVILKPLSQAIKDGNPVYGIIRGTAINHDGRAGGLTVPNGLAQQAVIEKALKDAKLKPAQVGYVECHGTGTSLGDPIEFEAIANVYGKRPADNTLFIGSLKTNIGHLEAAAGIAGLIKTLLCLKNRSLVPHLHVQEPSSHIPWRKYPQIQLIQENAGWQPTPGESLRRAAISSFGFTGSNAHVIVEEYVAAEVKATPELTEQAVLTISAKSASALNDLKKKYIDWLPGSEAPLHAIAHSSQSGREHFAYRIAVAGSSKEEWLEQLAGAEEEQTETPQPKVAFLFTGQGAQYHGMGATLYKENAFFREKIEECARLLEGKLPVALTSLLFDEAPAEELHQTRYAQPALFAIEYATASLWMHLGVQPDVLLGHSIGELPAACLAGVFSLEDALTLVAERGRLMHEAPGDGVMYSVEMPGNELEALVAHEPMASVAAQNTPVQSVLSGQREAVDKIVSELQAKGIHTKALKVSHAFHSPLMQEAKERFYALLKTIKFTQPAIPVISNLTGKVLSQELATPEYWAEQIVNPVRFADCIEALPRQEITCCLEVGPNPVLLSFIGNTLEEAPAAVPTLRRVQDAGHSFAKALAKLYQAGADLRWENLQPGYRPEHVLLPNYAWQHQEYWVEGTYQPAISHSAEPIPDVYQEVWQEEEVAQATEVSAPVHTVLAGYQADESEYLKAFLERKGQKISHLQIGEGQEAIGRVLQAIEGDFNLIVCPTSTTDSEETEETGWQFIALVQELERQKLMRRMKTCAVVLHAEADSLSASQNGLITLSRVLENELGAGGFSRIILEGQIADDLLEKAFSEMLSGQRESTVSLKGEQRKVLRLKKETATLTGASDIFSREKSYLITGGTGALGVELVRWAATQGARHMVLVSRSGKLKDDSLLIEMQKAGLQIEIVAADIADRQEVDSLCAKFGSRYPALGGVFHLAGVLADATMTSLNEEDFRRVYQPKAAGAWHLHEATRSLDIDYFVQFSSVAAVLGAPGQVNYAFANSVADSLTHLRAAENLPCLTLNWGPWAGAGMAESYSGQEQVLYKHSVEAGFRVMAGLMTGKKTGRYLIGKFNETLTRALDLPLLRSQNSAQTLPALVGTEATESLSPDGLKSILAGVLEIPASQLENHVPVINYGFDSLLALKTKNKIYRDYGIDLNTEAFMRNPSIDDLYAIISEQQAGKQAGVAETEQQEEVAPMSAEEQLANLDNMTEEEIDALLKSMS